MKKLLLVLFLLPCIAYAQIPAYYSSIDFSKSGDSLKWQLATLVTNTHTTPLEYTSSSLPDTWDAIKQSDLDDSTTTQVLLIYGYNDLDSITKNDRTRHKDSSCHTSGCIGLWNREHVFPQSLANPPMTVQYPGIGTDVHNIRAVDGQENSARGNDLYAEGTGNATNLTSTTYYPGDEWRGDVARIIMYMYLRYDTICRATSVGTGSTSYSVHGDMPNVFLDWNALDPPTQYEKDRNSIFQAMQGNRNPFIDNPYLATRIWGGPQALSNWMNLSTQSQVQTAYKVYPTYTTGIVYVDYDGQEEIAFKVYNSCGQLLQAKCSQRLIDLNDTPQGFYFLQIISQEGSQFYKLYHSAN